MIEEHIVELNHKSERAGIIRGVAHTDLANYLGSRRASSTVSCFGERPMADA